jgi:hypothetical protein
MKLWMRSKIAQKVRLEEFERTVSGGQQPPDQKLLSVSLSRAETVARLNKVNQLLEEYVRARTPIDSLSRVQSELGVVSEQLSKLDAESTRQDGELSVLQMRKEQLLKKLKSAQDEKDDDQDQ